MQRCERDKIGFVPVKSVSRFGRNTADMLKALRTFHTHGVDVFFEKENLWLHEEELRLLVEAYCAFAQAESEEMSRNIRWGIRRGSEKGASGYANSVCFGYKRRDDGEPAIDAPDAAIVLLQKTYGTDMLPVTFYTNMRLKLDENMPQRLSYFSRILVLYCFAIGTFLISILAPKTRKNISLKGY